MESNRLVEYLMKCDEAYYKSANPIVNDSTYDALVETLRKLDPTHEYLKKVGVKSKSDKVGRLIPMGTLSKYHTDEDIMKWLRSENDESDILVSPKYDGFALELCYDRGRLVSASTRGDGHVGEDALSAVMRIRSIPIQLSKYVSEYTIVRGEVIIPSKYHQNIKDLGYSAMRNAVPGIVRANRAEALTFVDFVAYEFIDGMDHRVSQRVYYKQDFIVEDYVLCKIDDFDSMKSRRDYLRSIKYQYELDGIVLKTNRIKEDDLLNPTHMISWKYPSKLRETTLREIEFNVGATGSISVVGIFDPVEFQGAKLTRASFGSLALYREMKPVVGDIIEVSRRGDIIPWIEGVTLSNSDDFHCITTCPCCNSTLVDDKCTNSKCSDRVKLKLLQYIQGTKTKGLGQSLVKSLVDENLIISLKDIYDLNPEDILRIPRQGSSVVEKWRALQEKKLSPLEFLCAYPIENAGESMWKSLLDKYSIHEILYLTEEELLGANIRGIGESKVKSVVSQLLECREDMLAIINKLDI